MKKNKAGKKLGKRNNEEENSAEINRRGITNFTDKYDWDFILDREWLRIKK